MAGQNNFERDAVITTAALNLFPSRELGPVLLYAPESIKDASPHSR